MIGLKDNVDELSRVWRQGDQGDQGDLSILAIMIACGRQPAPYSYGPA